MDIIVSMTAVRRAWELARAHGHFWASISCSPENLRRARVIRDLYQAQALVVTSVAADKAAGSYTWGPISSQRQAAYASLEAAQAAYGQGDDLAPDWTPVTERVIPASREEAETIGWSKDDWGGVRYVCNPNGTHYYTTATGRTNWSVAPDGTTTVSIDRPGVEGVVKFCVTPKGTYKLEVAPYEGWDKSAKRSSGSRHVGAALTCALALEVPGLVRQLQVAYRAGLVMDLADSSALPEGSEEREALKSFIHLLDEQLAA